MSGKKRQQKYRENMLSKGFVEKTVWVPKSALAAINAIKNLRLLDEPSGVRHSVDNISFCEGTAFEMWRYYQESLQIIGGDKMSDDEKDFLKNTTLAALLATVPSNDNLPYTVDDFDLGGREDGPFVSVVLDDI